MNPKSEKIFKNVSVQSLTIDPEFELRGSQKEVKKFSGQWKTMKRSVEENGILQPILARCEKDPNTGELDLEHPILVDGRQRFAIANELGLDEIPIVIDPSIQDVEDIIRAQIDCNIERIQQSPTQVAEHLLRMVEIKPNITVQELADLFGKTIAWVSGIMKLKNLTPDAEVAVKNQDINLTSAIALGKMPTEHQPEWLQKLVENPSETQDILMNMSEALKDIKKGGKGKVDSTTIPNPRSKAKILELWNELKDQTDSPFFAGVQMIVQLDPESMQLKKLDKETAELAKQIKKDEKALKEAEKAQERLEKSRQELAAAKQKVAEEFQEI